MNNQQYKLYAAEANCAKGRNFGSIEEIQKWVDSFRDQHWWFALNFWPVTRVEVIRQPDESAGSVGGWFPEQNCGRMKMAKCHWNELIVLHELAHVLAEQKFNSQAHCPFFARTYLELVYSVMGSAAYVELKAAFDRSKINYDADTSAKPMAL